MGRSKKSEEVQEARRVANELCKQLNARGFHVLRYDPPFSSYIKIDGGLCHSIRVSGHASAKTHLSYRYNVLVNGLDNDYVTKDSRGYVKYYAKGESIDKIIDLIMTTRKETIGKYGEANYYSYVLGHLIDNKNNEEGFWSKAKTLKCANKNKCEYYYEINTNSVDKKVKKLEKEKQQRLQMLQRLKKNINRS